MTEDPHEKLMSPNRIFYEVRAMILMAIGNMRDAYPLNIARELDFTVSYVLKTIQLFKAEDIILINNYNGRRMILKLTEKGQKAFEHIKAIRELLGVKNGNFNVI